MQPFTFVYALPALRLYSCKPRVFTIVNPRLPAPRALCRKVVRQWDFKPAVSVSTRVGACRGVSAVLEGCLNPAPRARPQPCSRQTPLPAPPQRVLGGSPATLGGSPAPAGGNILPACREHPHTAAPDARVRGTPRPFAHVPCAPPAAERLGAGLRINVCGAGNPPRAVQHSFPRARGRVRPLRPHNARTTPAQRALAGAHVYKWGKKCAREGKNSIFPPKPLRV